MGLRRLADGRWPSPSDPSVMSDREEQPAAKLDSAATIDYEVVADYERKKGIASKERKSWLRVLLVIGWLAAVILAGSSQPIIP